MKTPTQEIAELVTNQPWSKMTITRKNDTTCEVAVDLKDGTAVKKDIDGADNQLPAYWQKQTMGFEVGSLVVTESPDDPIDWTAGGHRVQLNMTKGEPLDLQRDWTWAPRKDEMPQPVSARWKGIHLSQETLRKMKESQDNDN